MRAAGWFSEHSSEHGIEWSEDKLERVEREEERRIKLLSDRSAAFLAANDANDVLGSATWALYEANQELQERKDELQQQTEELVRQEECRVCREEQARVDEEGSAAFRASLLASVSPRVRLLYLVDESSRQVD